MTTRPSFRSVVVGVEGHELGATKRSSEPDEQEGVVARRPQRSAVGVERGDPRPDLLGPRRHFPCAVRNRGKNGSTRSV
jgi:hypothetical protein